MIFQFDQKIIFLLVLKKLKRKIKEKKELKRLKKQRAIQEAEDLKKTEQLINDAIEKLRIKAKSGQKIKVAFLHMYSVSIQSLSIFDKMLQDDLFDPYFILNPDNMRSKENFDSVYKRTKKELVERYGDNRVLDGYNFELDTYYDYTNDFDIANTSNQYDTMAHDYFKIDYWTKKGVPVFYVSYAYLGRTKYENSSCASMEYSTLWKIFSENKDSYKSEKKSMKNKGRNLVISGYPKMDRISEIKKVPRTRKRIILAPHHTIFYTPNYLNIGNFLTYYDFLQKLPEKYPDIDFIFRPHALLFENLKHNKNGWGEKRVNEYIEKISSYPNCEYQTKGDYLETFVNSDGLIHDCGSFLAEYFYTDHPQCVIAHSKKRINEQYLPFGKKMLSNTYLAFREQDILNFIDNVIIKESDPMKQKRIDFANKKIKINYPNCSEYIVKYIKEELAK